MKTNIKLSLAALASFLMVMTSCKKNDDLITPATVNNAVTSGTWQISSFTQRTEDKTSDFAGLDFTFADSSKLIVSGNENFSGTWSYTAPSTGYYGSANGGFSINLGTGSPFQRLSRSWNVASQTATVIKLDASEATEDEHVTFTKK